MVQLVASAGEDAVWRTGLVLEKALVHVPRQQKSFTGVVHVGIGRLAGILQEAQIQRVARRDEAPRDGVVHPWVRPAG